MAQIHTCRRNPRPLLRTRTRNARHCLFIRSLAFFVCKAHPYNLPAPCPLWCRGGVRDRSRHCSAMRAR
ncbi:hypothetical protein NDU88_001264 [Pleurodeles waltl]|uniref:Uncharacterized protein n=1 Tax=Pleurodeles waltl TaxID=8319 RepID=A0AAV7L096_PLEWA|nr:hypothetical protein NDU88_001264 [Pleurodeles waltl]